MNPITYALNNLRMHIPIEVLEKTFFGLNPSRFVTPTSLDSIIRDQVIDAKVLVDCNLIGSEEVYVPLQNLPATRVDNFTTIYNIPKSLTQGRSITSALSVAYGFGSPIGANMSGGNMGLRNSSSLLDAASGVMMSQAPIPDVSTAYVTLIGENTIMIQDTVALPGNIALRCKIESDANFSQLSGPAYMQFAELVLLATKAFIYVKNQIPMDRAYLSGGQDLNAYRNIIDSYSDAAVNYNDYFRTVWRKVSILDSYQSKRRHLGLITGGRW